MKVMISQPMYFPWAGFISQMALADIIIWLDDVKFSKGSFTNRIQVKTPNGIKWMSIPLVGKGSGKKICDLKISNANIPKKHKSLLINSFSNADYNSKVMEIFENVWEDKLPLIDTLIKSAESVADVIGVSAYKSFKASEFNINESGSNRVLELVKVVSGDTYITGHGASNYLNHFDFESSGISVQYMNYNLKKWPQSYGNFTPYVTALDLIAYVKTSLCFEHLVPRSIPWQTFIEQDKRT